MEYFFLLLIVRMVTLSSGGEYMIYNLQGHCKREAGNSLFFASINLALFFVDSELLRYPGSLELKLLIC